MAQLWDVGSWLKSQQLKWQDDASETTFPRLFSAAVLVAVPPSIFSNPLDKLHQKSYTYRKICWRDADPFTPSFCVSVVLVGSYQTFMSNSVLRTVLYWPYIIHTPGGHFVLFENGSFRVIFYHRIAGYCWEVQFYDSSESFMAGGCHLDSKTSIKWFVYVFKKGTKSQPVTSIKTDDRLVRKGKSTLFQICVPDPAEINTFHCVMLRLKEEVSKLATFRIGEG